MATTQSSAKNRVYYYRLQNLIIEGGTPVVRKVLDHLTRVPLTMHLQQQLKYKRFTHPKNKTKRHVGKTVNLTQAQYDQLFVSPGIPSPSVTSADLDITLLVCLLQYTCDTFGLQKATDKVWFSNPLPNNFTIEADIVRMRKFRNELSHRNDIRISQQEFESKWKEIKKVLLRLYSKCTSNTQSLEDQIDELETDSIDEEAETRNEQILEEWEEIDKNVQATQEEILDVIKNMDPPRLASLKDISKRYFRRMNETENMFVKTLTYRKAAEKLSKTGIVILSGYAGEGKTTMASQLLLESCPTETILKLSVPNDMVEVSTKDWNGIFIDDILGTTVLEQEKAKHWHDYLQELQHDARDMRLNIVMTTRKNILRESNDRFNLDLFKEDNIVNVSSSDLSKTEKKDILTIHLTKNKRSVQPTILNACIMNWKDTECQVGFPECAVMFATNKALFDKGPSFFAAPFELFKNFLADLSKNENEFMILAVIWTKPSKTLSQFDLAHENLDSLSEITNALGYDLKTKTKTLRKVLHHHKDGLLRQTDKTDEYTFSHNVIGDIVGLVLSKDNPDVAIKYGTKSFIMKYITTNSSIEECVLLDERRFSLFGKKLNELLFQEKEESYEEDDIIQKYKVYRQGTENMRIAQTLPDVSILDHEVFSNETFIKEYVSPANGNDIVSTAVLEVFEHFRNPYSIVFRYGEMGMCLPGILLARGNDIMIKECIDHDILTNREMYLALLIATRDNKRELVQTLVSAGAEVNEDTLQIAVINRNVEILRCLLSHSQNFNSTYSHIQGANSPLITAVKKGFLQVVKCLLQMNIDVNYKNKSGQSALDKAIKSRNVEICELLIEKGCQLDVKSGKFDRTPLHTAVSMGNLEIVKLLLKTEASLYTTDIFGYNLLHTAAVCGNIEIFRVLLHEDKSLAMNPFKFCKNITTLYHYAVHKESKELLLPLIENEIDLNMQDRFGRTPLYFAVYYNKQEFVKLLIEKADVTQPEKNGYTPLHAAVFKLNTELVDILCKYYSDIRMVDKKGNSLLHVLKTVNTRGNIQYDTRVQISKCIEILLAKDKDFETMQNKKGEIVNVIFDGNIYYVV